jgi:hypothetical protein
MQPAGTETAIAASAAREPLSRRLKWLCVGLIAAGAGLRLFAIFRWNPLEDALYSDMASYAAHAQMLMAGSIQESHFFQSIGFPVWVAALRTLADGDYVVVKLASLLMSTLTFVLAWRAAARVMPERLAVVVLAAGAFHFPWIFFSSLLMAETPFALLLTALFYLLCANRFPWAPRIGVLAGVLFAVAMLVKGTHALFGPLLAAWVALWCWHQRSRAGVTWRALLDGGGKGFAAFCVGVAIVLVLQAAVTLRYYGQVRLTAHAGALNFVEGKCPWKNNADSAGAGWHSPLFVQLEELTARRWPKPFTDSAYFWVEGWKCIAEDPLVLLTSVRYIHYLFFDNQLWPANVSRWRVLNRWHQTYFAWLLFPGILAFVLYRARHPLSPDTVPFLVGAAVVACVWFFKGEMRFRIPFDAVFLVMAMLGWIRIGPAIWPGLTMQRLAVGSLGAVLAAGALTAIGLAGF